MLLSVRSPRAVAAAVSVAALAFGIAACGSEEEETASGGLSTAASPASDSTEGSADADNPDGAAEGEGDGGNGEPKPEGQQAPAADGNAAAPTLFNPFEDGDVTIPVHEPLTSGGPGADADREEMQRTVHAAMNPASYDKWTRVLMENSCDKVTDPIQAEIDRAGLTLDQVEQAARMQQQAGQAIDLPATDVKVDDVRVDGNRASATVTATNANGTQTQTQIFEREDGRWKLCS